MSADIPAGPLSGALAEFARQTGLQLVYVSDVAKERTSHEVRAGTLPAQALTALLADTGLSYTFVNDRTVRIYVLETAPEAPRKLAAEQAATLPPLEELVVLASRGGEQVRDVPISLLVWSADAMDRAGAKSLDQVAALTPSVEYDLDTAVGAGISTNLSIRGVNDAGGRSTTRIFVDDAPLHSLQSDFGEVRPLLFDVDRVEVIRGPQGALLGEGTEGGAVRLLLRQPSLTEFSGGAHVEAATTENGGPSYEGGAAAGGPIVRDLVGFRLSAWYRRDGGYVDHVDPFTGAIVDADSNWSDSKSGRVALSVAPAEGVLITPSLSYQSVDLHDSPIFYQNLSNLDAGVLRNGKLLRQPYDDSYTLASLNLSADLSFAHFTAVASYFHRSADALVDYTNSYPNYFRGEFDPLPVYPVAYENAAGFTHELDVKAATAEVRLRSPNPEARLTWMAGAFYSNVRQGDLQTLTNRPVYIDKNGIDVLLNQPFDVGATIDSRIRATQIAGFGEADLRISSRLRASIGLRATVDESQQSKAYSLPATPESFATQRDIPVAPRADLSYQANPGRLLYAAVAKGYRSAGIDPPTPFPCTTDVLIPFPADSVWSAELGTKNAFAGARAQLELSVYYMRWQNLHQLLFSRTNCTQVANEDDATSRGFDLALQAFATAHLRTELALSYIDAHYSDTSYLSANGHDYFVISRGDWLGALPQVPSPWTATASIAYEFALPRGVTANLQVQDIFHSHNPGTFFTRPTSQGCSGQSSCPPQPWAWSVTDYPWADPATNVVNLRARFSGSNADLSLYVNNALNSQPLLLGKTESSSYGAVFPPTLVYGTTLRPRTVGVVVGTRF